MAKRPNNDEAIISSLMANGTLKAAAAAVGISERTLYDRMNDGEFRAKYTAAKADIVRAAVVRLNSKLQAAIDVAAEIMENKDNNPAIRLQAAQTILNNAGKFSERLQITETTITRQEESNLFSVW